MSENIQSISNGTFTLGQTNNLTFEAGPGIQISEPSEGTVRIGNDETVLWSGNDTGSANITLSESITNFNMCRFKIKSEQGYLYVFASKSSSADIVLFYTHGQANAWSTWLLLHFTDAKTITVQHSKSIGHSFTSNSTTLSSNLDNLKDAIVEVVGINRISGSNA